MKCIENVAGKHRSLGVAYCTHASTISTAGVPAVVFGPGSIAQAHTEDEFIEIKQLDQAAEIYFQFAKLNLSAKFLALSKAPDERVSSLSRLSQWFIAKSVQFATFPGAPSWLVQLVHEARR